MTTVTEQPTKALELKIDALVAEVAELTRASERERRRQERLEDLVEDAAPLLSNATERLAQYLDVADHRGYFDFAKAGLGVIDEVVVNFTEEDVRRLGENIVLILETVKEMTQPEVMRVLHRMIEAVERQRVTIDTEPGDPPSLWQLVRKTGEPEVRRGLGRALSTLAAVSEAESGPRKPSTGERTTEGGT